jgi:GntR family transcriptional repressor for pyruvate dehydrogenase complex
MLSASPRPTISDDALTRIIEMIRAEGYAPGDRLPGERQLAGQLKVSRTSVRTALGRLVTLGLLEARPGSGTFVKAPSHEVILAALAPHIFNDAETLSKLFELREIIEVEATARAAQRATPEHIALMRHWAEQVAVCATRKDRHGLVRADVEFHRQIVIATGNEVLVNLIDSIAHLLREMRYASTNNPELLPGQRVILAAIEAHDSQAARQAMIDHLKTVRAKAETFLSRSSVNGGSTDARRSPRRGKP